MSESPAEFSPAWFDESSKAWMANKRKLKYNAVYRYTCQHHISETKKCGRDVYKTFNLCRQHWAKSEKTTTEWSLLE